MDRLSAGCKISCVGPSGYSLGAVVHRIRGGIAASTGVQSRLDINAIIATHGLNPELGGRVEGYTPPLSNRALFCRDQASASTAEIDSAPEIFLGTTSRRAIAVVPIIGTTWSPLASGAIITRPGRTPEEAGMQLLAIPFTPTHAEYVFLQGKTILSDQMDFLLAHFPRNSPLRLRATTQNKRQLQ